MRSWHTAIVTAFLALLYAPVFEPSLTVLPLLGYAALILMAFAVVDAAVVGIGVLLGRRPSWFALTLLNVAVWCLAWIV